MRTIAVTVTVTSDGKCNSYAITVNLIIHRHKVVNH